MLCVSKRRYDALRASADDRLEIPGGSRPARPGAVREDGEKAAETADYRVA